MFSKKLVSIALVFAGATAIAAAQNDVVLRATQQRFGGNTPE
ncbi:MAG TPA: hypothetical protein VN948_03835 [Terriglobales bacterium]|nr:hypothetical protein [Terriglobales bacterium]